MVWLSDEQKKELKSAYPELYFNKNTITKKEYLLTLDEGVASALRVYLASYDIPYSKGTIKYGNIRFREK